MMRNEVELAGHVVSWLEGRGWDVFQEVRAGPWDGRIADIVAVRGRALWVIECKRSLTLGAIEQAHRWPALMRGVAVPASLGVRRDRRRQFAEEVCRQFQIGVLAVAPDGNVWQPIAAPILRAHREPSAKLRAELCSEHKEFAPAGSAGGARWTPYRRTMRAVLAIVRESPGLTVAELMERLDAHHYPTDRTARVAIWSALRNYEEWCYVDEFANPPRLYHVDDRPSDGHGGWLFDPTPPIVETEVAESGASSANCA